MTWLAWRQFRTQALVACIALLVFVGLYGFTGMRLHHLAQTAGFPGCLTVDGCRTFTNALRGPGSYPLQYNIGIGLMYAVPILIGLFWGAPLVAREFAGGAYRMLWIYCWVKKKLLSW